MAKPKKKVSYREVYDTLMALPRSEKNPESVYTTERGDHCLVGQVLTELGVPIPGFNDRLNESSLDPIAFYPTAHVSKKALRVLQIAQDLADDSLLWGEIQDYIQSRFPRDKKDWDISVSLADRGCL